jgi:uncharacterized protein (TIGR02145 family)
MKKLILSFAFIAMSIVSYAQVGIGTTAPAPSSALDVTSSTKGLLPPRMTSVEMKAIANPAEGLMLYCMTCIPKGLYVFNGNYFVGVSNNATSGGVGPTDVVSTTGKIWMDRNLGASQVANSSFDYNAYGSLYQWGRLSDGHQIINWTSSASSDGEENLEANETTLTTGLTTPPNSKYIVSSSNWYTGTSELWQGVNGVNNPCPTGFRVPTKTELENEINSWGNSPNRDDAFSSVLKLPVAGRRDNSNGSLGIVGSFGFYWSSTVDGLKASFLYFNSSNATIVSSQRASASLYVALRNSPDRFCVNNQVIFQFI